MNQENVHNSKINRLLDDIAFRYRIPRLEIQGIADGILGPADPTECLNCGASMAEYDFVFDSADAILLYRMAREVKHRAYTLSFTEANRIHVPDLSGISHAIKCRTTHASKLGLIAKFRSDKGTQVPGVWVITERGWAALRGELVPAKVKVFRGEIIDRYDEKMTLSEALQSHRNLVERVILAKRNPKSDYRTLIADYAPSEWVNISGYAEGALF